MTIEDEEQLIFAGVVGHTIISEILDEAGNVRDISGATVKKQFIKKPDGVVLEVSSSFSVGGADGRIQYTSVLGDIDISGTYFVQAYLELPTWQGYSSIEVFKVYDPLG